jgi:hypothetical protein
MLHLGGDDPVALTEVLEPHPNATVFRAVVAPRVNTTFSGVAVDESGDPVRAAS